MPINIGNYTFAGPYIIHNTKMLEEKSGVYAILCRKGNRYDVIDIGESALVRARVENHDREICWSDHCKNDIYVAVHYTYKKQQRGRMEIELELREEYKLPCGLQ